MNSLKSTDALPNWLENQLNDPVAAVRQWEALLLIDAQNVEALQSVWKLYCEQGRQKEMFRTLDGLARAATNVTLAGQFLVEAAEWVESGRFDNKLALECWKRAHRQTGGINEQVLSRLKGVAQSTGKWSDCADALLACGRTRARPRSGC